MRSASGPFLVALRDSPVLRALFVLLFAAAAAQSLPISMVALFAKDELGASNLMVTVYFALVAVAGLVAVLVIGHLTDVAATRRPAIRLCFAWLAVGYLAMSAVLTFWQLFMVGLLFTPALGVLMAQLMALTRETAGGMPSAAPAIAVTALSRSVFSLGYITGAPLGSLLAAVIGTRHVMQASACVMTACLITATLALRSRDDRSPGPSRPQAGMEPGSPAPSAADATQARPRAYRLLVMFCVACVFLSSGRVMQLAMLPVVMRDDMHAPASTIGIALAIPPLLELVLMPLASIAALRVGRGVVYLAGGASLVAYYMVLTFAGAPWQIFANQVGYAVYGAAGIMLGIDIAQNLLPERISTATSAYLSHEQAASVLGSITAVLAVGRFGPQHAFGVPLAMSAGGFCCIVLLFVRNAAAFDLRRGPDKEGRSSREPCSPNEFSENRSLESSGQGSTL
jgi:predicted MFS family arabinose efflux permease